MVTTMTTFMGRHRRRKCDEAAWKDRHTDVVASVEAAHHMAPAFVAVAFMGDHREAVAATAKEAVIEVRKHEISLEDATKHRPWRRRFRALTRLVLKCSL